MACLSPGSTVYRDMSGQAVGLTNLIGDAAHDLGHAEVLGREHRGHSGRLELSGIGLRDDSTDDHWHVTDAGLVHGLLHIWHQFHVRTGQDRQSHAVHVLGHGRRDDLCRREPNALVDDLEAGIAGTYGDLLGAIGAVSYTHLRAHET